MVISASGFFVTKNQIVRFRNQSSTYENSFICMVIHVCSDPFCIHQTEASKTER